MWRKRNNSILITVERFNVVNTCVQDQRVVTKRPGGLREGEPEKDCDPGSSVFSIGRGKRRQLLVTTSGNIKVRLSEPSCKVIRDDIQSRLQTFRR